uniref:Uncharacterized protein n=1 Tax=Callorhinchus milii TaxID=7868 RepID=A0A4W3GCI5_CALMI
MTPIPVVDLLVGGFDLDAPGAHVEEEEEVAIEELHGKVVGLLGGLGTPFLLPPVAPVAEEEEAVGFGGAEVEGDGARLLGVPPGQRDVGLGGLEGHGVQRCHVLAPENQVTVDLHLGVPLLGQPRQLQLEVIVLVDHL